MEPFTELRNPPKGGGRAEIELNSGCGLECLLEISDVQVASPSCRMEVWMEAVMANCALCLLTQLWPQHVHKAAFPVLTSPVGLEGSLPETQAVWAPGTLAMDTFWRRPLQSGHF